MRTYVIFGKTRTGEGVFSTLVHAKSEQEALNQYAQGRDYMTPVAWTEPVPCGPSTGLGEWNALHPVFPVPPVPQPEWKADLGPLCGDGLR